MTAVPGLIAIGFVADNDESTLLFAQGEYVPVRISRRGLSSQPPCMKASAAYLTYRAAATAEVLSRWGRVVVELGVDRETGLPRSILRITPAQAGEFGYKVRQSSGPIRRVWLYVPIPARW